MRVKLLTLQCVKNYGSVLQTYATETILNKYFDNVETINYIREDTKDSEMINTWLNGESGIKKAIKRIYLFPMAERYKHIFNGFVKKYLHLTEQVYSTEQDFYDYPMEAEAFCVGSDQVWNSGWNKGIIKSMFLDFVPNDKMKFAFCSSFGKVKLDDWEENITRQLLERLQYISVRETTAVELLNEIGIRNSVHLLDPTLLIEPEIWRNMSSPRIIGDDYVLVYQLNPNKKFDEYAYELAKRKNLKLVYLSMKTRDLKKRGRKIFLPEVEEFLSLIQHAKYVVTDSFHGTAFSINFNKQFINIFPAEYSTRIRSILKWADLSSRHLNDFNNFEIADTYIDYAPINEKLVEERKKADRYLLQIISDINR